MRLRGSSNKSIRLSGGSHVANVQPEGHLGNDLGDGPTGPLERMDPGVRGSSGISLRIGYPGFGIGDLPALNWRCPGTTLVLRSHYAHATLAPRWYCTQTTLFPHWSALTELVPRWYSTSMIRARHWKCSGTLLVLHWTCAAFYWHETCTSLELHWATPSPAPSIRHRPPPMAPPPFSVLRLARRGQDAHGVARRPARLQGGRGLRWPHAVVVEGPGQPRLATVRRAAGGAPTQIR